MTDPTQIRISDFDYFLPETQIAQFPLENRDASKLLVYRNHQIEQDLFINIATQLPEKSLLVFNDTRVIRARLIFHKETGAPIEIFCLEPMFPVAELQTAFQQPTGTTWKCLVGNLKRWKTGLLQRKVVYQDKTYTFSATKADALDDGTYGIHFEWDAPDLTFGMMLELAGQVPLPPYIHRQPESSDADRYQTIFARHEGSVAAPTAGLHFTQRALESLHRKNILFQKVTLHVGVGTFRPVNTELIGDHVMHHEKITVTLETLEQLLIHSDQPLIAVGTTAARTLESIYWIGYQLISNSIIIKPVLQWTPYQTESGVDISKAQSLAAFIEYLKKNGLQYYSGETQLMIVPGYKFRMINGLVTNFHMPQSTLLLLVSAMIGEEWRKVYDFALHHEYRFLSYGDACLFFNHDFLKK
jgi:S-adenosylmethionine:tRNA ribosyltransferase-isomerase